MNRKKTGLVAILIGLVVFLFWTSHGIQHIPIDKTSKTEPINQSTEHGAKDETMAQLTEKQKKYLERASVEGKKMNRPVDFFGVIIDQNNKPLAGAKIKIGLSRFSGNLLPDLMPNYVRDERVTDGSGRFKVVGENGVSLDIEILPTADCEIMPNKLQVSFRDVDLGKPAPEMSTDEKPFLFHAFRRSGNSSKLVQREITLYEFEPDGRWYTVHLKDGEMSDRGGGGDFRISLIRPPGWAGQNDYDWTLRIEALDVQLLENRDEYNYTAPATGYGDSWVTTQKANSAHYSREAFPVFFFKNRNENVFGKIQFEIKSGSREKSAVLMRYWIAPTGERLVR